jgi:hypothetical protein
MSDPALRTFAFNLCAPIPVGHHVVVQFWEVDTGIIRHGFKRDGDQPSVLDRTTGVAYGARWQPATFFGWTEAMHPQDFAARAVDRVEGTVRACAVMTGGTSTNERIMTVLTIEIGTETEIEAAP